MTLEEFDLRMLREEKQFLAICLEFEVWDNLVDGRISPTLATAFAEGLILDLSTEATRTRIQLNPAGAAAVAEVVQALIHDRKHRPSLAAAMPPGKLAPFYVMSSLVLDVPHEELQQFEQLLNKL
jgi:hypothetical protein